FFFSSRRRHTRFSRDWSSDVCSSDLESLRELKYIKDWHDHEEYAFHKYIPEEESAIREMAFEVLSTVKSLPKDRSTYGLIHGDLDRKSVVEGKSVDRAGGRIVKKRRR